MPILAAYIDAQSISLLVYVSTKEYSFYNFPYTYSSNVFGDDFDENSFYTSLFESYLELHKLKLSQVDLLLCSVNPAPNIKLPYKMFRTLPEVFASIHHFYPIAVNNFAINTKDFTYHISKVEHGDAFYSNMKLYPQLVATDSLVQLYIDSHVADFGNHKIHDTVPLVFCGSRFGQNTVVSEMDYLLMLGILKSAGIFDIRIDKYNSLILTSLLTMFDSTAGILPDLENEGTFVHSKFSLECMFRPHVGGSKLINVDKNRIMLEPLAGKEHATVMIKARDISNTEREVVGGRLGLLFDTREDKKTGLDDIDIFKQAMLDSSKGVRK